MRLRLEHVAHGLETADDRSKVGIHTTHRLIRDCEIGRMRTLSDSRPQRQ